jgi:hypothetical protein
MSRPTFRKSARSTLAARSSLFEPHLQPKGAFRKVRKWRATPKRSRDLFVFAASQVKFTPCVLAAIISVLCAANAKASPFTYTESATVSTFNVGENILNSTNKGGGIFQFVKTGTGTGTFSMNIAANKAGVFGSNSDGGTFSVLLDGLTQISFAVGNIVAGSPPIRSTCERAVTGALKDRCPPVVLALLIVAKIRTVGLNEATGNSVQSTMSIYDLDVGYANMKNLPVQEIPLP